MSLEAKIEALTAAVHSLINVMNAQVQTANVAPTVPAPAAPFAPPVAQATIAPAPAMPAPPTFAPPAPAAPAPVVSPFADQQGLIAYATQAYHALGAEKGAGIQNVMAQMGVGSLTDIKPEQYAQFVAGVEALR